MNETLMNVAFLLAVLFGPWVLFAFLIHQIERLMQRRLAERFGWKSVMWTGWLGTPIHELSHALMCRLFGHRVDEVVLFEPDPESGRLGYVRHSYRRKNWFEEIGNVFIGIAPLIGGSLVLGLLLWLFYPDPTRAAIEAVKGQAGDPELLGRAWSIIQLMGQEILAPANLVTVRFWTFIYLVFCVGSHMAPSRSDYRGAGRGALILSIPALVLVGLLAAFYQDTGGLVYALVDVMSPLFAVLLLTVLLCAVVLVVVYAVTSLFPVRYTTTG
ncbi:MAG: metalloprotease family protein [Mariniblastus sp.]|nr:metalloprotease family protein [Mariniblastus sp.]